MRYIFLASFFFLSSCVYIPSKKVREVREVESHQIANCELIGQIHGESEMSYLVVGVEMAKDRAKQRAANIGATHVVWTDIDSGIRPFVTGRAYRCHH